ncbi:universal stress protein [Paralimibaculum aggregatum]|uniref:Universal stress protein n=1 Tax=Paralimibaculum aggregatum TaxID=3036245 RepID=A0ABQ6LKG4_9RHOB|nr:universal stress protein [Limibaculum sp. NKW23]GMG83472.1 universal stress protein [Limibaculum sp. NKW23]
MSYKSLLTYTAHGGQWERRLEHSLDLATALDAHLTVLAFAFAVDLPPYTVADPVGAVLVHPDDTAREDADAHAREIGERIARAGVRGDAEPVVCARPALPRELGDRAKFADLVVLDRPYGEGAAPSEADALEGALFDGDAPVLICPDGFDARNLAGPALIAWNGSREALRAVRRSIPLLRRATSIEIDIYDPPAYQPDPGERMATMLARQGLDVEVSLQRRGGDSTAEAMARRSMETGASLMVMGAYSHSWFREWVLGGVTREVLETVPLPILLSH